MRDLAVYMCAIALICGIGVVLFWPHETQATMYGPGKIILSGEAFRTVVGLTSDPPQCQIELRKGQTATFTPEAVNGK